MELKEAGALLRAPTKELAEQQYHQRDRAQEGEDHGLLHRILRLIQRPGWAYCWAIEQACSRIEIRHEIEKWNERRRQ